MKITLTILILLVMGVLSYGENTYKFKVSGFHCEMCPKAVEKAVKNIKGIKEVKLTLIEGKWENGANLEVSTDKSIKPSDIITAIEKADKSYKAQEVYNFKVYGLHCDMCPKMIEKAVKNIKGVKECKVELIGENIKNGAYVTVEIASGSAINPAEIISAIQKADKSYTAEQI